MESIETLGSDAMKCLLRGDHQAFQRTFLSKCDPKTTEAVYQATRELARKAFASGDLDKALQHYTGLLAIASSDSERAKLFSNRSLCCLKLGRSEDAVEEAKKAIACDPKWDKAWFRAAKGFFALDRVSETLSATRYALKLHGFNDPCNVKTSNPEVMDILHLFNLANEKDIKVKRIQRYTTDYTRFHKLADELTAMDVAAEQAERQAQPVIEFAPGLSEEQKVALTLQLTGRYDERLSKKVLKEADERIVIDLRVENTAQVNLERMLAVGGLFQIQYEASYGQRLIGLLDSGIASRWAEWTYLLIQKMNLSDLVYLGYGSILSCASSILLSRPSTYIHLCDQCVVPSAYDFLYRVLEANSYVPNDRVRIHSRSQLLNPPYEEPETETPPSSDLSDIDEAHLANRGATLMNSQIIPIPRNPDLLIIDPASIEGYLLGPLNPLHDLRCYDISRLFPARISLYADLINIKLPSHLAESVSVQSALRWSLLPQKLLSNLQVETHSDPILIYTLDSNCSEPKNIVQPIQILHPEIYHSETYDSDTLSDNIINAVRFYLKIEDSELGLEIDTRDIDADDTNLGPHFWWLNRRLGLDSVPLERMAKIKIEFINGQLASCRVYNNSDDLILRSDPVVCNSCDRFMWSNQISAQETLYPMWENAVKQFASAVVGDEMKANRSRISGDIKSEVGVEFIHLDVGSILSTLHTLPQVIKFENEELHNVKTRLLTFDCSQGTCRLIKGGLRSKSILNYLAPKCVTQFSNILNNQWNDAHGRVIPNETYTHTQLCDWIWSRDSQTRIPSAYSITCGGVRTLRPPKQTPDNKMALCQLFGVAPDTPGLDNMSGCHILEDLVSGVLIGDVSTLPSDGLSQGLIPTILYTRRALAKQSARFLPSHMKLMGAIVRLPHTLTVADGQHLDFSCLRAVRNPSRSTAANNITDSHCFVYGSRTQLNWNRVQQRGGKILTRPILLAHFDFATSDEHKLLSPLLNSRLLPVPSNPDALADGLLIWAEWTLWDDLVVGNPPEPFKSRVKETLDVSQAFQLLPQRPISDLEFLPLPNFTDYIVTWKPKASDPSYMLRDESMIKASTSLVLATITQRHDELAMQLGQQILTSPKSAKEIANTAIALVRSGNSVNLFDSTSVNNLLFATLA